MPIIHASFRSSQQSFLSPSQHTNAALPMYSTSTSQQNCFFFLRGCWESYLQGQQCLPCYPEQQRQKSLPGDSSINFWGLHPLIPGNYHLLPRRQPPAASCLPQNPAKQEVDDRGSAQVIAIAAVDDSHAGMQGSLCHCSHVRQPLCVMQRK